MIGGFFESTIGYHAQGPSGPAMLYMASQVVSDEPDRMTVRWFVRSTQPVEFDLTPLIAYTTSSYSTRLAFASIPAGQMKSTGFIETYLKDAETHTVCGEVTDSSSYDVGEPNRVCLEVGTAVIPPALPVVSVWGTLLEDSDTQVVVRWSVLRDTAAASSLRVVTKLHDTPTTTRTMYLTIGANATEATLDISYPKDTAAHTVCVELLPDPAYGMGTPVKKCFEMAAKPLPPAKPVVYVGIEKVTETADTYTVRWRVFRTAAGTGVLSVNTNYNTGFSTTSQRFFNIAAGATEAPTQETVFTKDGTAHQVCISLNASSLYTAGSPAVACLTIPAKEVANVPNATVVARGELVSETNQSVVMDWWVELAAPAQQALTVVGNTSSASGSTTAQNYAVAMGATVSGKKRITYSRSEQSSITTSLTVVAGNGYVVGSPASVSFTHRRKYAVVKLNDARSKSVVMDPMNFYLVIGLDRRERLGGPDAVQLKVVRSTVYGDMSNTYTATIPSDASTYDFKLNYGNVSGGPGEVTVYLLDSLPTAPYVTEEPKIVSF